MVQSTNSLLNEVNLMENFQETSNFIWQIADEILRDDFFSDDGHAGKRFDYMLVNPPYGKDCNKDEKTVKAETGKGQRFEAGTPRKNDG